MTMTIEELQTKLRNISLTMGPAIEKGMADATMNIEGKAKENCTPGQSPYYKAPLITGTLRRSINSKVEQQGNEIKGIVGADTDYAEDVHEGTSRMPPRPFILDAITEKETETIEFLTDAVKDGIRRHTRAI